MTKKKIMFLVIVPIILVVLCLLVWQFRIELQVKNCIRKSNGDICYSQFLQEGVTNFSKEEYNEAIKNFRLAEFSYNNNALSAFTAYRNEANALLELGKYSEAEKIYKILIALPSDESKLVYADLIRLYQLQNRVDDALKVADDGYAQFKDKAYMYQKAYIYEAVEKFAEEVSIYQQLLLLDPGERENIQFKIDRLRENHGL